MTLWAGSGYQQQENALPLGRVETGGVGEANAVSPVVLPAPLVLPERGVREGAFEGLKRALSFGAYKGLEDEEAWKVRVDRVRAQSPLGLSRCGVVCVAQPKGGVGKTPVAMLAASSLRAHMGAETLLWDLNDNGGARWFIPSGAPSVSDLVAAVEGGASRAGVTSALVTQDSGSYRVLAARADRKNLSEGEFHTVQSAISTMFDHVVIDTGNSITSRNLSCAIKWADVVVVPTDWSDACLDPTLTLLSRLEEKWGPQWGQRVVVVESNPVGDAGRDYITSRAAATVHLPYDPHIASKGLLAYSLLSPGAQRAGLALAAAIADVYRQMARLP